MTTDRQAKALERLSFFSDAVFAIAMTLLVIEVRVPHLEHADNHALVRALLGLLPNYIGFLVSFAVIARFWMGHHRIFGMLDAMPPRLVQANLLLLLVIAFMPFPTAVLSDYVQLRAATIFYAGWLVVVGFANMLMVRTALRDPAPGAAGWLRADVTPGEVVLARRNCWLPVIVGVLAAAAAFVSTLGAVLTLVVATPLIAWLLRRSARVA